MWDSVKLINFGLGFAEPNKLLLLSKSGSHLHGTNTPASDFDYKGIFLPDPNLCLLDQANDTLKYSSGEDDSKNTCEDVDIELWSIQKWCRLLKSGDSNALGILFSTFNPDMVVFVDPLLVQFLLEDWQKMFHANNVSSLTGFADSQVFRYALKGERLRLLESLLEWIESEHDETGKKLSHLDIIGVRDKIDPKHKYLDLVSDEDGRWFIKVLGKKYMQTITIGEFVSLMKKERDKYGERTKRTQNLGDTDWKSISHAFRCYYEAIELLNNGYIKYPLSYAEFLLEVKQGKYPMDELEEGLEYLRAAVTELKKSALSNYDESAVFSGILKMYSIYRYNGEAQ